MTHKKVQVIVIAKEEPIKVLRLQTLPERKEHWQHVTGSVDDGESFLDGAIRELFEETGIKLTPQETDLRQAFKDRWGKQVEERVFLVVLNKTQKISLDKKEHQNYEWNTLSSLGPQSFGYQNHYENLQKCIQQYLS